MDSKVNGHLQHPNRRRFLAGVGAGFGVTAASASAQQTGSTTPETVAHAGVTRPLTDKEKVARIAANSYPIRFNFKTRNRESEEVNHPFCEASPDFCNWEHEYLLFHALNDLAPYAHTNVHAKYWDRWENPDVQRNVRIMLNHGYTGVFALEYEAGPWDGVEGAKYLYREVMAAL